MACRWIGKRSSINAALLLTHWGRVMHICVGKLTIIGSDNGLSPGRRQAIIWTNAGILLIGPLGTKVSEFFSGIKIVLFKKMHLKMSSSKWRPFCLGLNVLTVLLPTKLSEIHCYLFKPCFCVKNSILYIPACLKSSGYVQGCGCFGLWPFQWEAVPVCGLSVCGRFCWGHFWVLALWPVTNWKWHWNHISQDKIKVI